MENKTICGIYKITSPSGKVYIGHSKDIKDRWLDYKRKVCKKQRRLYNSLVKYGSEKHTFEIIEECIFEELNKRERHWQDFYDVTSKKGLNCHLTKTDELKLVHSEDTIRRMREAKKGKKNSEESKEKNRIASTGKRHTAETKKQMRENMLGDNHPRSKVVLNTETGIFYTCVREAAEAYNISKTTLGYWLRGERENISNLKYV